MKKKEIKTIKKSKPIKKFKKRIAGCCASGTECSDHNNKKIPQGFLFFILQTSAVYYTWCD